MRIITVGVLAFSLALGGCNSGSPAASERAAAQVEARRVEGGIRLTNRTDRPVAYAVWNAGWLALFAPCTDTGPACPRLAAGASVVVPLSEVGGSSAEMREVIVRWWGVVPDGAAGFRAETVHKARVGV